LDSSKEEVVVMAVNAAQPKSIAKKTKAHR
jgi:hypothetical protein